MTERDKTATSRAWANYEAASDAVTRAARGVKRSRQRFDAAVKARNEAHLIWMRLRKSEEEA